MLRLKKKKRKNDAVSRIKSLDLHFSKKKYAYVLTNCTTEADGFVGI